MSYIVPKEIPNRCGRCPCFHAEHPMYCQAVKADKNKRIYALYGECRPDWCPLIEVPTPHGRLVDLDKMIDRFWDGNSMEVFKSELEQIQTIIEAEE